MVHPLPKTPLQPSDWWSRFPGRISCVSFCSFFRCAVIGKGVSKEYQRSIKGVSKLDQFINQSKKSGEGGDTLYWRPTINISKDDSCFF